MGAIFSLIFALVVGILFILSKISLSIKGSKTHLKGITPVDCTDKKTWVNIDRLSLSHIKNIDKIIKGLNCWEFSKCGRETYREKVSDPGICPAVTFTHAHGFLGGKNGGRACTYITGTFCSGTIQGTHREKEKNCTECDFYRILKRYYGPDMSIVSFNRYVTAQGLRTIYH